MLGTIAFCLVVGLAGAEVPSVQADRDQEVEREIKALELHLAGLLVQGDFDTYSTFLSQDYTRINDRGEVQTRQQVLHQFRASRAGFTMEPTELVVQSYGDTAILTGLLKARAEPSSPERTSRFRKVFVRRSGRWYLVSLQGVPYTPGGAPPPQRDEVSPAQPCYTLFQATVPDGRVVEPGVRARLVSFQAPPALPLTSRRPGRRAEEARAYGLP